MKKQWKNLKTWLISLKITIEPLIFFLAACNTAVGICSPGLKEDKMRRVYPAPPGMDENQLKKFYNKKMVMWDNFYEYINLPVACVFGIIYGGFSDNFGRKYPLLCGLLSVLISNGINFLVWNSSTDLSLNWFYPTAFVSGLLGDFLLTMSCINAYITDEFQDKVQLSYRMVIVSILFSLGSFCASRFVSHLVKWTSKSMVVLIAEAIYLIIFALSCLILTQKKPTIENQLIANEEKASENQRKVSVWYWKVLDVVRLSFISIYESAKLFVVARKGYQQLFLYLCFFANFLDQFVWGEEKGLLGIYVRLPPFEWNTSTYADYKSWRPIVQIIGMTIGIFVFKKILHFRNTFIIFLSIMSMAGCVLMIGLAQESWMIFASLAPGSLHGLLNPLSYTFLACIVDSDEIGKAYAISSVAEKIAGILQSLILQNIYIATVDWYQGFVWLLMAAISFLAAAVYLFIHILSGKQNVEI